MRREVLLTGATGLLGGATLRQILRSSPDVEVHVLVRRPDDWAAMSGRPELAGRVTAWQGDVAAPHCGLSAAASLHLRSRITHVLHAAADTSLAQSWDRAYLTNAVGTRNVLRLAERMQHLEKLVQVSSAFVAGCRSGVIREDRALNFGFVNAYERSKYEAEEEVRRARVPWTIARCGLIACDDETGSISRLNALHRGLALIHAGLIKALPGTPDARLDIITADYAATALEHLLLSRDATAQTVHLCAGGTAITMGDLLATAFRVWSRSGAWRGRGIHTPEFMDLATYHQHEFHVQKTGDVRSVRAMEALKCFVPQLAFPKCFETARADDILGYGSEPVSSYWRRVVERLPVGATRPAEYGQSQQARHGSIQLVS